MNFAYLSVRNFETTNFVTAFKFV